MGGMLWMQPGGAGGASRACDGLELQQGEPPPGAPQAAVPRPGWLGRPADGAATAGERPLDPPLVRQAGAVLHQRLVELFHHGACRRVGQPATG